MKLVHKSNKTDERKKRRETGREKKEEKERTYHGGHRRGRPRARSRLPRQQRERRLMRWEAAEQLREKKEREKWKWRGRVGNVKERRRVGGDKDTDA